MNTPPDQLMMGCTLAAVCLAGFCSARWFATTTSKGQWLSRKLGDAQAVILLRVLFAAGVVIGVAFAADWIRPLFDSRE